MKVGRNLKNYLQEYFNDCNYLDNFRQIISDENITYSCKERPKRYSLLRKSCSYVPISAISFVMTIGLIFGDVSLSSTKIKIFIK